ncbi:uncharacterized protein VTP21DRAFT_10325 [Calcarisporiella thermophila]|uniref:uncharacterized protein n=1 Tax=Calcarisporiella thermophila TaxID=911321 RepID=UPI003742DB4F
MLVGCRSTPIDEEWLQEMLKRWTEEGKYNVLGRNCGHFVAWLLGKLELEMCIEEAENIGNMKEGYLSLVKRWAEEEVHDEKAIHRERNELMASLLHAPYILPALSILIVREMLSELSSAVYRAVISPLLKVVSGDGPAQRCVWDKRRTRNRRLFC